MLKPLPMAKVALVGPKKDLAATIDALHDLQVLHIEDYVAGDDPAFELGSPLKEGAAISERLVRLRGILKGSRLEPPAEVRRFSEENLRALEDRLAEVERDLGRFVEERTEQLDRLKALEDERALLVRAKNFPLALELLQGYRSVSVASGFVPADAPLSELKTIDRDVEVVTSEEAEGHFVAVFTRSERSRAVLDRLATMGFSPLELPPSKTTPQERIEAIARERADLEGKLLAIEQKIGAVGEHHAAALFALDEHLTIQADKATSPVHFRTTQNSFMIEGWVPELSLESLRTRLSRQVGDRVFLARLEEAASAAHGAHAEAGHDEAGEDIPVLLSNGKRSSSYQLLTDTYSRPKYSEIDPTLFIFFGFPFFYGFMLGDVGYAALLLIMIWTGTFTKIFHFFGFQATRQLNKILLHSSISSVVFGIIYGEVFGLEFYGEHGLFGEHAPGALAGLGWPVHRLEEVLVLLLLTVGLGAFHMLIGLVLGFRNAWVAHGLKAAVTHRGSWLGILGGIVVLAVGFGTRAGFGGANALIGLGVALFVAGLVLLVIGEGAIGIMEVPTIISNLLSYTRLVAIGLSSVGIALAGNNLAQKSFFDAGGVGMTVGGIAVLLIFHTINLGLGIMGPALHSLRLHYVEFFTKFFEGGGTPFAPFGYERKYTQKEVKGA